MPREREASWYRPITIDTQRARLVDGELLWKYTDETLSLKSKNLKYRASDPPSNQPDSPNPAEKKGIQPARVGRDGSVEEPITDEKYRAQVDAELKEAEKQWSKDERRKEDEFERIHNQKLEEWRTKLRNHTASYDDHPDVLMMKKLTGQEGTLIAPSVAKEYDNMLMDRGWYPYAKPGDWKYYYRSKRGDYDSKGPHPDVPSEIKLPGYNAVREHFLKGKSGN